MCNGDAGIAGPRWMWLAWVQLFSREAGEASAVVLRLDNPVCVFSLHLSGSSSNLKRFYFSHRC